MLEQIDFLGKSKKKKKPKARPLAPPVLRPESPALSSGNPRQMRAIMILGGVLIAGSVVFYFLARSGNK